MENTEHAGVKSARRLRIPEREIHEFKISDVMAGEVEGRTPYPDVFDKKQGGGVKSRQGPIPSTSLKNNKAGGIEVPRGASGFRPVTTVPEGPGDCVEAPV